MTSLLLNSAFVASGNTMPVTSGAAFDISNLDKVDQDVSLN